MGLTDIKVVDFRGNVYGVGDIVLYPRMSGRSVEMQEGKVLEFKPFEDEHYVDNPEFIPWKEHNWQTNPRQIREKFTNYKVKILPTRSSRNFYRTGTGTYAQERGEEVRPVWIQIPNNVVKG